MRSSVLLAIAASLSSASAVYQGFNYGATRSDGTTPRIQSDYEALFAQAKSLAGTNGAFSSARLYTMIQAGTASDISSAIPAAMAQDTTLLLGLWASVSSATFQNEISALTNAIKQHGSSFTSLVAGISVGSEDLYRISPTGIAAKQGYGQDPSVLADYIGLVKQAISGTALSGALVGHVDTWTAWVNGTNQPTIDAADFIGVDAYPYFQDTMANSISSGPALFNDAISATQAAVGGKPVWITETGWPVSGDTRGQGVASVANAKTYYDAVGCANFGKVNTWWYTSEDTDNGVTPNPSFGLAPGTPLSNTPLYDLSCADVQSSSTSATGSSSTSASASASASGSVSSVLSSASGAATSAVVSATGGLTPSQGAGAGGNGSSATAGSGPVPTGNASSTLKTGTATVKSSASATSTLVTVTGNAANAVSGSIAGVMGAMFLAIAAL